MYIWPLGMHTQYTYSSHVKAVNLQQMPLEMSKFISFPVKRGQSRCGEVHDIKGILPCRYLEAVRQKQIRSGLEAIAHGAFCPSIIVFIGIHVEALGLV